MNKYHITIDSCIVFDLLNTYKPNHQKAKKVVENSSFELFLTESTVKEIKIDSQKGAVEELINSGILKLLPEPQMGVIFPAAIPMDFSHISKQRDGIIESVLKKGTD